jgi:hypothetical protein
MMLNLSARCLWIYSEFHGLKSSPIWLLISFIIQLSVNRFLPIVLYNNILPFNFFTIFAYTTGKQCFPA